MSSCVTRMALIVGTDRGRQTLRLNTVAEEQARDEVVGRKEIVLHEFLLKSWQCLQ
jgi:hypothetical protein